ncbi:hypothetical protein [Taibaiella helva]|uniref:hypothetical protein n=1 Tax=Taibaiella helva TaxID=2301235 RepID=UPI000E58892F|nr:hypothetical protein [Taibaiella helva]
MRFTLLLITLCFFFFITSSAQDYDLQTVQKDRSAQGFKGAVMQVTERQWVPAAGAMPSSAQAPDSSYSLEHSITWVFDSSGRALSVQRRDPDERRRKALTDTGAVFYYNKGKLVALSTSKENKRADSVSYRYLRNGLPDQCLVFDSKDALRYKITYAYRNGQVSMLRRKDKDNMVIAMIRYQYNSSGHLVESRHFDQQLRLTEIRRYSVRQDSKGEQGSYSVTGADGKMKGGASWVKDAAGRTLEENQVNGDREVTEFRNYTYGVEADPVSEKTFNAFVENDITYRYTYDEQQNWIRKEAYNDVGLLRSVTLRTIRYGH